MLVVVHCTCIYSTSNLQYMCLKYELVKVGQEKKKGRPVSKLDFRVPLIRLKLKITCQKSKYYLNFHFQGLLKAKLKPREKVFVESGNGIVGILYKKLRNIFL